MSHLPILPVVIPLFGSFLAALQSSSRMMLKRGIGIAAVAATMAVTFVLVGAAQSGSILVYELGNWQAPFGIVLVVDRLSAIMVALTSVLAFFAQLYACRWDDEIGDYFHFFFLVQVAGINGAFLTGDIFNLFVFFEILLIASYNLLLHGGGKRRVGAGLHYVIYNLTGSGFFIMALAIIYGLTGTLNMADLAMEVAQLGAEDAALFRAGAMLLIVVFAVKGAILPLYFWLPRAYGSATAPVAALFAVMTKIGIYAILRVCTLVFNQPGTVVEDFTEPWMIPIGIATMVLGGIGAFAAERFNKMIAYLVIWSVGTIVAVIGVFTPEAIGATLYYMLHSTLITGAIFLLAGIIQRQRGDAEDELRSGPSVDQPTTLSLLFFALAIAMAGMPPSSGFLGKLLMLDATTQAPEMAWIWGSILAMGLVVIVAFARAGSVLFWKTTQSPSHQRQTGLPILAVLGLLICIILMTVFVEPIYQYSLVTGHQLLEPDLYIDAVLNK